MSKHVSTPTIIAGDVHLTGSLNSEGEVQLDGTIDGDLKASTLLIGNHGKVEGSIEATEVTVRGTVLGSIRAEKVSIESSATVHGDIFHKTLSIAAGANMQGQLKHLEQKDALSVVANNDEQQVSES